MRSERDFWSRRRAAVDAERTAERDAVAKIDTAKANAALEDRPENNVLDELGLPVPETVHSGGEAQKFMAQAVPEYLRRRALRALWKSNPALACLDGLNDYDGDFTNAATDAPGVKTAYRVGKGLKAHLDHLASLEEPALNTSAEEDIPVAAASSPDNSETILADASDTPEGDDRVETPEDEPMQIARPRRMAFAFDTGAA